jgi:predicted ribosomally synthesized peptide with SipW-like signal peptide
MIPTTLKKASPMKRPREIPLLAVLLGVGLVLGLGGGVTYAAFSATTSNGGNSFSTAADWTPPTVPSAVIAHSAGVSGFIGQGKTYRVYANVSDSGNPASGVSTVTANVTNITAGQNSANLSSGSFTVGGTSYGYRSNSLTADNPLSAGSKSFSITATDGASNSATQNGFSVTVDNTTPSASDVQAADGGGTTGKLQQGDTLTFTYSEAMDPDSISAGWTGSSTNVVVHVDTSGNNDPFTVYDSTNATLLKLGTVSLGANYVTANRTFGASGTASTMVMSGSTVTITLGNPSGVTKNVNANATMSWAPSTSATDRAGNACSATAATESGAADIDF